MQQNCVCGPELPPLQTLQWGGGATSRAKPAALKYCSQHKTVTCSANFYFFGNATQIRWPCRFARELNRRFHQWRDHWHSRAVFCCWRRQIPPLLHVTGCRAVHCVSCVLSGTSRLLLALCITSCVNITVGQIDKL